MRLIAVVIGEAIAVIEFHFGILNLVLDNTQVFSE